MRLYHGSNLEISQVDLSLCLPYKDLGPGFYTTDSVEQARQIACTRTRSEGFGIPTVTVFEAPDDLLQLPNLRCRVFGSHPGPEWAVFVRNNRDRDLIEIADAECNQECKYDAVAGPVLDDSIAALLSSFEHGAVHADSLAAELTFVRQTKQISFHTEKALRYLRKVGVLL